jgi:hypothetical protein
METIIAMYEKEICELKERLTILEKILEVLKGLNHYEQ